MQVIENDKFKAAIDEHGAQLTHLYNKDDDFDGYRLDVPLWRSKYWR